MCCLLNNIQIIRLNQSSYLNSYSCSVDFGHSKLYHRLSPYTHQILSLWSQDYKLFSKVFLLRPHLVQMTVVHRAFSKPSAMVSSDCRMHLWSAFIFKLCFSIIYSLNELKNRIKLTIFLLCFKWESPKIGGCVISLERARLFSSLDSLVLSRND